MPIILNSTGGGQITLSAASTASNYTLTLPASTGTLATTSGAGSVFTNPTINGFTGDTSVINVGSGQFYKDTSGNVGIGTSSPSNILDVNGVSRFRQEIVFNPSGTAQSRIGISAYSGSSAILGIGNDSGATANTIAFYNNGTERMRIDSSGNVGIGTSSSLDKLSVAGTTPTLQLQDTAATGNNGNVYIKAYKPGTGWNQLNIISHICTWSQDGGSEVMRIDSSGKLLINLTSSYNNAILQAKDNANGAFGFTDTTSAVDARIFVNTTQGAVLATQNSYPIAFQTNGSERARFESSGSGGFLLGTTTLSGGKLNIGGYLDGGAYGAIMQTSGASGTPFSFRNSSGTQVGSIQTASASTSFNTSSDQRLKTDKGAATDTSVIDQTIIHDFEWKSDGSVDRGVFAQEAYEVKPSAVSQGTDELNEAGLLVQPWGVDYSKYVPDLIVYCQQLKATVTELTARLEKLEAK